MSAAEYRPVVTFDPAVHWGQATVRGVSAEAVAGMVAAGHTPDEAAADYGLTRHEVLLACWWEALYGRRTRTARRWRAWAHEAERELTKVGVDPAAIPDPPAAPGRRSVTAGDQTTGITRTETDGGNDE